MSLHDPSGFDPIDARWWPMIAASLPLPWPDEAVKMDLRWWLARERMGDGVRPGRPTLVKRYGWGDRRLRDLMAAPEKWEDAKNPAPRTAGVQPRSSQGPAKVQPRSSADTVEPVESVEKVQAGSSEGPAEVQLTSTRAVVHRTPSTDTVHRETETQDAPVPVAAPPAKPGPSVSATHRAWFDRCAAAWSDIRPGSALDIDGEPKSQGGQLLAAVRHPKVGGQRILDRFRLLHRDPGHAFRLTRDGKPTPITVFLRGARDGNGHTDTLDGEAIDLRDRGDAAILDADTWTTTAPKPTGPGVLFGGSTFHNAAPPKPAPVFPPPSPRWQSVLTRLKLDGDAELVDCWLAGSDLVDEHTVGVRNAYCVDWMASLGSDDPGTADMVAGIADALNVPTHRLRFVARGEERA